MKKCVLPLLMLLLLVTVMGLAGCPKPAAPTEVAPPTAPPTPTATATPPAAPAEADPAKLAKFTIPDKPVSGTVNGKPFTPLTVRIKKTDKGPVLEMSSKKADTPTGMVMEDTGVELTFPLEPGKPGSYAKLAEDEKDFDKEHAWYWYPQGGDKGPMSVNPEWGAAIVITDWTSEKDPKDEKVLGKVKGKVSIQFNDDKKSKVSGTFDAVYYE